MILLYVIEKNLRARTFENSEYVLIKSFQLNKIIITLHQELVYRTTVFYSVSMSKFIRLIIAIYLTTNAILGRAKCNIPLLL
jgi:hypothetical protein